MAFRATVSLGSRSLYLLVSRTGLLHFSHEFGVGSAIQVAGQHPFAHGAVVVRRRHESNQRGA